MTSKTLLILLASLTISRASLAAEGYYEYLPYYSNDPFTFCTVGVPEDCWAPIDAATGTFTVTNQYCFNPVSAATFARVCPKAFNNISSGPSSSPPGDDDPANASP